MFLNIQEKEMLKRATKKFDIDNYNLSNDTKADFLNKYEEYKKNKDFPSESEVSEEYFNEVKKVLKEQDNPSLKTISTLLDIGLKAAILYAGYKELSNLEIKSPENLFNKTLFIKSFRFITNRLAAHNLLEEASVKLMGLETLRHGTSILNYPSIALHGGDPQKGGSITGSSSGFGNSTFVRSSKNYFHVFIDNYGASDEYSTMEKRYFPRVHACLSGATKGGLFGATVSFLLSPTLRFYYHPENLPGQFVKDKDYASFDSDSGSNSLALKTPIAVKREHMGIKGIIHESLSNPVATKNSISQNLKDPKKIAYISACILGALVFAKMSNADLRSIATSNEENAFKTMTKIYENITPSFWENSSHAGLQCIDGIQSQVKSMFNNLILPTLYYSINIAK